MGKPDDLVALDLAAMDESDKIPLDAFAVIVASVRSMLATLDESLSAKWRIERLSMNSPGVMEFGAIARRDRVDPHVADNFMGVFQSLSFGDPPPPRVKPTVLRRGRMVMNTLNNGVGYMKVWSPGRPSVIPPRIGLDSTRAIEEAAKIKEFEDWARLEGYLRIIGSASGNRIVHLIDRVTGHPTVCLVSEADFVRGLEAMISSPDHSPRVAVAGKTLYRNNRPEQMKVERLEVFPIQDDKAAFYRVQGIDITGGMDSVDYVRSLRDD